MLSLALTYYITQKVSSTSRGLNLKIILCTLCFKGWRFYVKPGFFFGIFNGDLYFDTLNLELFQICLLISQGLGEDSL